MLEKVIDYLERKEWIVTHGKDEGVLFFPVNGLNAIFHCVVNVTPDNFLFLFITFNGTTCPIDKRLQLAELLNRINFTIRYGNFELGMEGGEIKFRTCICYEEMEINEKIIENVIMRNIYIHDFSFPLLSKFLFGDISMNDAYNSLFPERALENKETKLIEDDDSEK